SPTGRVDPAVAGAPGVARTPAAVAITRAAAVAITVATVAVATGGDRGPAVRTGVVTRRILHQPLRLQARQRAHIHVHHCPRYVCTPVTVRPVPLQPHIDHRVSSYQLGECGLTLPPSVPAADISGTQAVMNHAN